MAIAVYLVLENGEREWLCNFADLGEATGYALRYADEVGQRMPEIGEKIPKSVDIECDRRLQISILIINDGLLPARDAP